MSNRIYDSSQLIKRRGEKAVAGSFLTRMSPPNNLQGSPPLYGIKDSSIMNAVKTGHMTEYTRYPTCVGISPGCPCPETNSSLLSNLVIPGSVSDITFTVGSIIVSWNPPTTGTGPFRYQVTPYLNGVAQNPITTFNTSYKFTEIQEWQPYTFTVCAINAAGQGPTVSSVSYFLAPPNSLSLIMSGSSITVLPEPSLKYILNSGLDTLLKYVAGANLGPTRGSRFVYLWISSVASAWNWVRPESRISGTHDTWDWNSKATTPLSDNDSIIWICSVIDYITPIFTTNEYKSIYNCPENVVTRVKTAGEWNSWQTAWQTWYNYRQNDGISNIVQPTSSANWNETIIVDGTTVNNIAQFPQPLEWTRLTVQGKKQGYLTYNWDDVLSTCLTEENEETIENMVSPSSGAARDAEIDNVKEYAASLTDEQKIIAEFWAGGPGTVSPPLMFIWFWKEYMKTISISCPNMIFSLLDLAIHLFEGSRVTWRLKKKWMECRPIQEIRRRFTGQSVQSWNGTIDGSQWIPYQEANFVTPPFADFPSGHSHFSKAFALTMNKWFGEDISKNNTFYDGETLICPLFTSNQTSLYGNFSIQPGSSRIQPTIVPSNSIILSFTKWNDMADQAGLSRLYGGIHALSAHNGSQTAAVQSDSFINSTWNIQTA